MKNKLIRFVEVLLLAFSAARMPAHLFVLLSSKSRKIVERDIARWSEVYGYRDAKDSVSLAILFIEVMTHHPEFRNVFYRRVGGISRLIQWLCPPLSSLEISGGDIGPGLFIQHGMGTLISADHIGRNCWINQGVTIGFSNETDRPWIGDNVKVHAGAKVIGRVVIGDNAIVGLNTVVTNDVARGNTVFGVPGRVIWVSEKAGSDASSAGKPGDAASRAA